MFSAINGFVEFDGRRAASLLPGLNPTFRDEVVEALEAYNPDPYDGGAEEIKELQAEIDQLKHEIMTLRAEKNR